MTIIQLLTIFCGENRWEVLPQIEVMIRNNPSLHQNIAPHIKPQIVKKKPPVSNPAKKRLWEFRHEPSFKYIYYYMIISEISNKQTCMYVYLYIYM